MSRRIKKVQLNRNMLFTASGPGGMGDQRTNFLASEFCRISLDSEIGGVTVEQRLTGGDVNQVFTVPWAAIDYIEWVVEKKAKEPPKSAA